MFCARFSTEKLSPICFLVSIQQELLATNWNFLEYIFGIFSDDCFGKAEIQKERILRSMFHSFAGIPGNNDGKIFQNIDPTFQSWWYAFRKDILLHMCRMNEDLRQEVSDWLQHI